MRDFPVVIRVPFCHRICHRQNSVFKTRHVTALQKADRMTRLRRFINRRAHIILQVLLQINKCLIDYIRRLVRIKRKMWKRQTNAHDLLQICLKFIRHVRKALRKMRLRRNGLCLHLSRWNCLHMNRRVRIIHWRFRRSILRLRSRLCLNMRNRRTILHILRTAGA